MLRQNLEHSLPGSRKTCSSRPSPIDDSKAGVTEKNLDKAFRATERAGAVLLLDEADALFGKRTGAKDSHDRYANQETAYLLKRIDKFKGLAVLTSNKRGKAS